MGSAYILCSLDGEEVFSDRTNENALFDGMNTLEKAKAGKLLGERLVHAANSRLHAPKLATQMVPIEDFESDEKYRALLDNAIGRKLTDEEHGLIHARNTRAILRGDQLFVNVSLLQEVINKITEGMQPPFAE